ncbi:MAG: hypothetical protein M3Q07_18725, partial [Pseudobdellovibrionaceae bacterium]|nr:hypothetical protein [Pseudobdellovibrionaceae bacterium]
GGNQIHFDLTDENVQAVLDKFVADLKQQNAAVIEVEMIDWNTVVDFSPSDPVDIARSIRIDQLLRQLWRYQETLQKIDTYIYLYDQGTYAFNDSEVDSLKTAYNEVTDAIDKIISVGRSCYADAAACSQAIEQVVVKLPKPREAITDNEALYAVGHWDVLFPSKANTLSSASSGSSTAWRFNEPLPSRTLDGTAVSFQVDIVDSSCTSITDVLTPNAANVVPSFNADPIYYSEAMRTLPNGKKRYAISFAVKSGASCAVLNAASIGNMTSNMSIEDDSNASRALRRLAGSLKPRI